MIVAMALLLTLFNEPPIEGDVALLELMRDAQRSFQGRYPQGEMSYTVESGVVEGGEEKLQERVQGKLVWKGTKIRFQGETRSYVLPPGVKESDLDPVHVVDMIRDERVMSIHWIKPNIVRISDPAKVGPPRFSDLTPEKSWSGLAKETPWIHFIGPHPEKPQSEVKRYVVKRLGEDRIELVSEGLNGWRLRLVASREAEGQIVEVHLEYATSSQSYFTRYRWARDTQGRLYLAEKTIRDTYASPIQKRTITGFKRHNITHFDPDHRITPSDFDHAALKRIAGAQIEDNISGKSYRVGKKPKDTTREGLDQLIDEVKSRGFSRP